jgi:hypothetical protein
LGSAGGRSSALSSGGSRAVSTDPSHFAREGEAARSFALKLRARDHCPLRLTPEFDLRAVCDAEPPTKMVGVLLRLSDAGGSLIFLVTGVQVPDQSNGEHGSGYGEEGRKEPPSRQTSYGFSHQID